MSVKLRLSRLGRRHRPFFRLNAVESRTPRNGKIIEKLGHYDPIEKDSAKQIVLNLEIIPFQFATRSNAVEQFGRSWRHDGGTVTFKLQIPHDKLEIYSTRGEYLCSYPVQSTGEVKIDFFNNIGKFEITLD